MLSAPPLPAVKFCENGGHQERPTTTRFGRQATSDFTGAWRCQWQPVLSCYRVDLGGYGDPKAIIPLLAIGKRADILRLSKTYLSAYQACPPKLGKGRLLLEHAL